MNIYQSKGYETRGDYLRDLALDYAVAEDVVFYLANLLGPNEDFDGLIIALEDMEVT